MMQHWIDLALIAGVIVVGNVAGVFIEDHLKRRKSKS